MRGTIISTVYLRVMIDTERPTEIVQHFAYRGSSHRRKGSGCHIIDMFWLNLDPLSNGMKGLFTYLFI